MSEAVSRYQGHSPVAAEEEEEISGGLHEGPRHKEDEGDYTGRIVNCTEGAAEVDSSACQRRRQGGTSVRQTGLSRTVDAAPFPCRRSGGFTGTASELFAYKRMTVLFARFNMRGTSLYVDVVCALMDRRPVPTVALLLFIGSRAGSEPGGRPSSVLPCHAQLFGHLQ